jgi:hypothetical protein
MLIYRHRFSGFVAMPASNTEERTRHLDLCRKAMQCALTIIADHVHIVSIVVISTWGCKADSVAESTRNDDIL